MRLLPFLLSFVALEHLVLHFVSAEEERVLRPRGGQSDPCLLVQLHVQYRDGTSLSKWQCELSDVDARIAGKSFVDVEGLTNQERKSIHSGASSLYVQGANFSNGKLTIPSGAKKEFGRVNQRGSSVQTNDVRERRLTSTVDRRKVLAVRVLSPDSAPTSTLAQIRNYIFGTSGDISNLKERFNSCSYGELLMDPFNGTTTTNTLVIQGAYQLSITQNSKGVNDDIVVDAAKARLTTLLGNLTSQFNHVMLCLPPGTLDNGSGNWFAYAWVNHWLSVYNNDACDIPLAQVHELGHNLGLQHSMEGGEEYADWTCMMGNPNYGQTVRMCYNAAKSSQLGWYSLRTTTLDFSTRAGFNGKLIGINNYKHALSAGKYVYVKVLGQPYGRPDVYVSWNLATGINLDTAEYKGEVLVHTKFPGSYTSDLVAHLPSRGLYTYSNFTGTGVGLNVLVKSISNSTILPTADVDIYLTGCAPGICGQACNSCCVAADCPTKYECGVKSCLQQVCYYETSRCTGVFQLNITTDNYPDETSWDVVDKCTGKKILFGNSYSAKQAPLSLQSSGVLENSRYIFTMRDSYSDGMFDGINTGNFKATYNGILLANVSGNFGAQYSVEFGWECPK